MTNEKPLADEAPMRPRLYAILLAVSLLIWLLFTLAELTGMRSATGVISGTSLGNGSELKCLVYILLYLSATLIPPVLVIGAVLLAGLDWVFEGLVMKTPRRE